MTARLSLATLLFHSAASPPSAEIMNVRRIVIIYNTAGSVTVCLYLISNKQSLGFQNIKLVSANSDDKYNFEACNGIITSGDRSNLTSQHAIRTAGVSCECFPRETNTIHTQMQKYTNTYTHSRASPRPVIQTKITALWRSRVQTALARSVARWAVFHELGWFKKRYHCNNSRHAEN